MLQSRGFSAPKALLQKPLESYLFLHTSYRACLNYMRLFDLYLSREVRAVHGSKKTYTSKKAHSLLISINTSRRGSLTTKLQNAYLV